MPKAKCLDDLSAVERERVLKNREKAKRCYARNRDEYRARARKNYRENREVCIERSKSYRRNNKAKVNAYRRKRREENPPTIEERIVNSLRSRVANALTRKEHRAGSAIADLGCNYETLKKHLEAQFVEGMNWDNYGREGWHVDHVIPIASFDLTDPDQFKRAVHYTNLQPLWALDNLQKHNRLQPPRLP